MNKYTRFGHAAYHDDMSVVVAAPVFLNSGPDRPVALQKLFYAIAIHRDISMLFQVESVGEVPIVPTTHGSIIVITRDIPLVGIFGIFHRAFSGRL